MYVQPLCTGGHRRRKSGALCGRDGAVGLRRRRGFHATSGAGVERLAAHQGLGREETGIRVGELLGPVMRRQVTFEFDGVEYDSDESYFVLLADAVAIDVSNQTQREREVITEHRWWSFDELLATTETVYPEGLAQLVRRISAQP